MKNRKLSIFSLSMFVGAAAPLLSNLSFASNLVSDFHVISYGTYGNGNVWVVLDKAIEQPGCSSPVLELSANAPAGKTVISAAAQALATGATVAVQVDGCLGTAATFTGERSGTAFGVNKR